MNACPGPLDVVLVGPEVFAALELVALLLFSLGNGRGDPSVAPVRKALPSLEAVYLKEFWGRAAIRNLCLKADLSFISCELLSKLLSCSEPRWRRLDGMIMPDPRGGCGGQRPRVHW